MHIQIKNRWSLAVLFEGEFGSLKLAVEAAVEKKVNLRGSDLSGSDLRGSNLRGSDLRDSNLSGSNLRPIRDDVWSVLSASPREVPALREAIAEGRIDGSCYQGVCACLVGTLAKARGVTENDIPGLTPQGSRPAERFFMSIKPGDKPAKSQHAKIALQWVDEWLSNVRQLVEQK